MNVKSRSLIYKDPRSRLATVREQLGPGYRLSVDFHDFTKGMGGLNSLILITDRWSGLHWDYYLSNRIAETIIAAFRHLRLQTSFRTAWPTIFSQGKFLDEEMFMKIEPSLHPRGAERLGCDKGIKDIIRTMGIGANLPAHHWPGISRAATYLQNRTPKYIHSWRS